MPRLISLVGNSCSGKTTLLVKLVEYFTSTGLRVGTVKHTLHDFDFDKDGTDSHRHFHAGAEASMLLSPNKMGFVRHVASVDIQSCVSAYFPDCDIVILEGFKNEDVPKIEVYRKETGKEPIYKALKNVLAVAADSVFDDVHCLSLNDISGIAEFILKSISPFSKRQG